MISAHLFGSFELSVDDKPLPRLRSRKSYLLLALLILHAEKEVDRDFACQAVWPESTLDKSRLGLRQCLNDIRAALGENAWRLQAPTTRLLRLCCESCAIDLTEFDALCAIKSPDAATVDRLIELAGRPLLEQYSADFLAFERDLRSTRLADIIEEASKRAVEAGELSTATRWARFGLALNPLSEAACRATMKALAAERDVTEAVRVYSEFRLRLWRETWREPDPETVAVYQTLKHGDRPETNGRAHAKVPIRPTNRLIGREAEMAYIRSLMNDARLVTIVGAAGMGKSRLAMELAVSDSCPFVALAPLTVPELLIDHVARELGVPVSDNNPASEALLDHFGTGPQTVILDNAEHVVDACASLVSRVLAQTDDTTFIVTSRVALGIPGEYVIQLNPLSTAADAEGKSLATTLFLERANMVSPQRLCTTRDAEHLNRICVGLQGIPLAIELAAARLRTTSLAKVADLLDDQMLLLRSIDRTRPDGVRTMESAIKASYDAITERGRMAFRRLCVFPSSFSLEFASQLLEPAGIDCDQTLEILDHLVDSSLLFVTGDTAPRYDMFEAIRQFGRSRLIAEGENENVEQSLVDIMAKLMERAFAGIGTSDRPRSMDMLTAESDHWRQALRICRDANQYADMVFCVASYWCLQALGRETAFWLRKIIERRAETSPHRVARALAGMGIFYLNQCDYETADTYALEAIEVARESGDMDVLARALNTHGLALRQACRYVEAYPIALEALEAAISADAWRLVPTFRMNLGWCAALGGRHAEALEHILEAQGIYKQRGLPREVAICDYSLTAALWRCGRFEEAREALGRALPGLVDQGDLVNAGGVFQELLLMSMRFGDAQTAAHLVGVLRTIEERVQSKILYSGDGETERVVEQARSRLSPGEWARAVETAEAWNLVEAVDFALRWREPAAVA